MPFVLCSLFPQGRISRRVTVPLPDEGGRAAILGVHLRGVTLQESAGDRTQLARQLAALTTGFSGGRGRETECTGAHALGVRCIPACSGVMRAGEQVLDYSTVGVCACSLFVLLLTPCVPICLSPCGGAGAMHARSFGCMG